MQQAIRMKKVSAKLKEETVLRLLQGASINDFSRELKVLVPDIEFWKPRFLIAAREGLKVRGKDPVEKELEMAQKTIIEPPWSSISIKKELDQKSKREFVDMYRHTPDPETGRRYPVRMILRAIEYSSAAYYGIDGGRSATNGSPR